MFRFFRRPYARSMRQRLHLECNRPGVLDVALVSYFPMIERARLRFRIVYADTPDLLNAITAVPAEAIVLGFIGYRRASEGEGAESFVLPLERFKKDKQAIAWLNEAADTRLHQNRQPDREVREIGSIPITDYKPTRLGEWIADEGDRMLDEDGNVVPRREGQGDA